MPDLPLDRLSELERRYDGPIPPQHMAAAEASERRRHRGAATVLETQATLFLEAALRCETEIEELEDQLATRTLAQWQRQAGERQIGGARRRLDAHIACAAEALRSAAPYRLALGLPPHPLLRLAAAIDDPTPQAGAAATPAA